MEEITIKVTKDQAKQILEALKYRYVNMSNEKRAEHFYGTFVEVKRQIESQ